ncbi:MAG: competence/damage-inducible protein A, partial [Planctomycetota bacterium]
MTEPPNAAQEARRGEAIVILVGDELLAGAHPDLNGPYLARALGDLGVTVRRLEVHGDDEPNIEDAVRRARRDVGWVFVAGGLGPTLDDVTRHGVARALGVGLREDAATVLALRTLFRDLGRAFPESNRRQALLPEGATILPNAAGTAPGFRAGDSASEVVVLPGPPRELDVVWEREVRPWLARRLGHVDDYVVHRLALFGISESAFAETVG